MSRCYKLVLTQILSLPLDLTETRRRSMRAMSRSSSATFMESWYRRAGPLWPRSLKTVMRAAYQQGLRWACFGAIGPRWIGRLLSFHSQASIRQCSRWVESWRMLTWRPRLTIRSRRIVCGVGQDAQACTATGWMSMSPALSVGLSVVEVKIKCQCWCILLRNEIGSHPIPTNPAEQCLCSGFDWVPGGLIVMYRVAGQNWEKGPTFTPRECAEIYRMYLDSIISIAAWGHAQTGCWGQASMGCESKAQWIVEGHHTIPLHCREANFWLDASATTAGYVGFTGSHLACILLHFKALLSYLPNLEPMLSPVSQKKLFTPGAQALVYGICNCHGRRQWPRNPCHGVDTAPVQEWAKVPEVTSTFLSWGKSKSHALWWTMWFEPMFRCRKSLSAFESLETNFHRLRRLRATSSLEYLEIWCFLSFDVWSFGVSGVSEMSVLFLVLRIAGPVMPCANSANCNNWLHLLVPQQSVQLPTRVGKERCRATMQYCIFCKWFVQSMWLWLLHLHAIVWPPPQLHLWALRSLATATAQLQAGQVLCRWAQHSFLQVWDMSLQHTDCKSKIVFFYFIPRHLLNLNLFSWQCGNKLLCNCILPTVDTLLRPATCKNTVLQARHDWTQRLGSNHALPGARECILIWSHMHLQDSNTATLFTLKSGNFYTVVFGVSQVSGVSFYTVVSAVSQVSGVMQPLLLAKEFLTCQRPHTRISIGGSRSTRKDISWWKSLNCKQTQLAVWGFMGWSPVDSQCPGWDAVWIVQDRGGGSEKTGAKGLDLQNTNFHGRLNSALALQHSLQNDQDN